MYDTLTLYVPAGMFTTRYSPSRLVTPPRAVLGIWTFAPTRTCRLEESVTVPVSVPWAKSAQGATRRRLAMSGGMNRIEYILLVSTCGVVRRGQVDDPVMSSRARNNEER